MPPFFYETQCSWHGQQLLCNCNLQLQIMTDEWRQLSNWSFIWALNYMLTSLYKMKHKCESKVRLMIRCGSMLGRGELLLGGNCTKPRPCPQMRHQTLFNKLIALAYRQKYQHCVAFKICQNAFMCAGCSGHSQRSPSWMGRGHSSPYPTLFSTEQFRGNAPTFSL